MISAFPIVQPYHLFMFARFKSKDGRREWDRPSGDWRDVKECDCCGAIDWSYIFTENEFDLGRCGGCGLHYVRPMPSRAQRMTALEHGHFAGSQTTSKASLHLAQERSVMGELDAYVATALRFAPRGKWLDIGCGTGTFILLMGARGIDAEGIELTKDRCDTARRETRVPIYDTPLEDLNLPSRSYAAVTLINVFSHLTNPTETLTEIRRILLPGGIILLVTGEIGLNVKRRHAFSWDLGDHLYFLGERTAERFATKLGLELTYRDKAWAPATIYTRERFLRKGRSTVRNLIKESIAYTPAALRLLRWYRLAWHDADNPMYSSTLVLRKPA